jgi:hypothetical protein
MAQRRNPGALRASSERRTIRLNKKCREKPDPSLVFIISFGDVVFLFDLCKLYHSLYIIYTAVAENASPDNLSRFSSLSLHPQGLGFPDKQK